MDEALFSATYVDNYIDSVENLPDDVQRHLSRIRDIDVQYRNLLRDVDHYYDLWRSLQNCSELNSGRRARSVTRMQQSLIQAQELGDEKMQIVTQLQELIDHKTRQLDTDQKNLDIKEEKDDMQMQTEDCGAPTPQKQSRTQSPSRAGEGALLGAGSTNGYAVSNAAVSSASGGGNSTPNSERSGINNLTSGNSNGSSGNLGLSGNLENQRSNSKRSRRRNDTISNMELGGNESNSANEGGGSNGGERNLSQKSYASAGGQKKNTGQNQASTSGGAGSMSASCSGSGNGGSAGSGAVSGTGAGSNNTGKKKKRKARGGQSSSQANAKEDTPPPDPIDPDEPTYCVCNQISFGEMILCDNDLCPIEWFHFSCVSLVLKPKGKWYCPNCRGDRPNVMKPKAQFLKELERYNKEKEEKT